jgi:AcrR family transcriptional regulator
LSQGRHPGAAKPKPARASPDAALAAGTRAENTRERILNAALFHFAEYGLFGASLREISKQSNVQLSALHYHFGSKEELYAATGEHVFSLLSAERLERLRQLDVGSGPPTLESVLEAFIVPVLKLAGTPVGIAYLRLQARMYDARELTSDRLLVMVLEATAPFRSAIKAALPDVPEHDLIRGYRALVRDVLNTVSDPAYEVLTGKPSLPTGKKAQELVDLLVRYHAAGLRAIASPAAPRPTAKPNRDEPHDPR